MPDTRIAEVADELRKDLTSSQADGETVLVAVSSVSLTAVALLLIILITAVKESYQKTGTRIFRSHVTAYFVSLLVSDLLQAIGSIMNSKWIQDMAVSENGFCSAQGAIKQAADVGTAFWISTIATHTFLALVLGIHVRRIFMILVLIGGWSFVGVVVAMGPFIIQDNSRGPYFSISGYWCWISEKYETEQIVLEYMMMFLCAVISFISYILVFLKLRGNLLVAGWRLRLRAVDKTSAWTSYQSHEASDLRAHMDSVAKHMLLYPIAYTILIVPIAACRIAEWTGREVPFSAVIFSDSVFLLSGFVNTLLFVLTGRVLPLREILSMFKPTYSRPGRQAGVPDGLEGSAGGESDSKSSPTWNPSPNWREKDLPQLPQETYSVMVRTSCADSLGRRNSERFSVSETSGLLRV